MVLLLEGEEAWLAAGKDVALMAGGGGRPGVDLIGGGRRGRSFTPDGLERRHKDGDSVMEEHIPIIP